MNHMMKHPYQDDDDDDDPERMAPISHSLASLLRLLEISGAKEPSALEMLVKGMGVKAEAVSKCVGSRFE